MLRYGRFSCFLAGILALSLTVLCPARGEDAQNRPAQLVGTWQFQSAQGTTTMVLNADGKGTFNGGQIGWAFNQGTLVLVGPRGELKYQASVSGDSLTLTGEGLPAPMVWKRVGSSGNARGTAGGVGSLAGIGGQAPAASALIGKWQGEAGFVEIKANGIFVFPNGQSAPYTIQGDALNLQATDGVLTFKYKLSGDTLTLTGPSGQVLTLTTTPAGNVQEAPEPAQGPTRSAGGLAGLGAVETPQPATSNQPHRPRRGLTESDVIQLLEGGVASRRVMDLVEERGVAFAVTPAVAAKLKAKGASNELIAALRKAGETSASGTAPSAAPSSSDGLAGLGNLGAGQVSRTAQPQARPVASSPAAVAPRGQRYSKENWGLNFIIPEAWKVGERGGVLLVGSDTEAGLMIIRFVPKAGLAELQQLYAQGIQEEGFQAFPATQLEEFRAGSLRGVAGEMSGQSAQAGGMVRVRAIGVASQFGGAAIVLGLTTEPNYPNLKRRTDELAATVSFTERKIPPVVDFLAGRYWRYSGSSTYSGSYSSESGLTLCDSGYFSKGGQSYSSGQAGIAAGQSGNAGQWTADGDEYQGIVTLTYSNGRTEQLQYVVSQDPKNRSGYGPGVSFGGRMYQRTGSGSCAQ